MSDVERITAERQAKSRAAELAMPPWKYRQMVRRAEALRRKRAEACRSAAAVLLAGSGMCAMSGVWLYGTGAGFLPALGALTLAGVAALLGLWCDGWSRR